MKPYNILSCFDGMSNGQIALTELNIPIANYYASEIDKFAMKVTKANFPNTIHVGNIIDLQAKDLPKIDLLIGGSPCQGFSKSGKKLNFEDPRSKLFFEFLRLKNELQPTYFLLENVPMDKDIEALISNLIGINAIEINSNLTSAQNRSRLYWTNVCTSKDLFGNEINALPQPRNQNISINDILQAKASNEFYLDPGTYKNHLHVLGGKKVLSIKEATKKGHVIIHPGQCFDWNFKNSTSKRGRLMLKKSNTLTARNMEFMYFTRSQKLRRFTPVECECLQNVPDNYTKHVSKTQRYKMLGNGWSVGTIKHIFSFLNSNNDTTTHTKPHQSH